MGNGDSKTQILGNAKQYEASKMSWPYDNPEFFNCVCCGVCEKGSWGTWEKNSYKCNMSSNMNTHIVELAQRQVKGRFIGNGRYKMCKNTKIYGYATRSASKVTQKTGWFVNGGIEGEVSKTGPKGTVKAGGGYSKETTIQKGEWMIRFIRQGGKGIAPTKHHKGSLQNNTQCVSCYALTYPEDMQNLLVNCSSMAFFITKNGRVLRYKEGDVETEFKNLRVKRKKFPKHPAQLSFSENCRNLNKLGTTLYKNSQKKK